MFEPRKLAAIDLAILGPGLIIAEFAIGVVMSIALGIFALARAKSPFQNALGVYLVLLGVNYVPMLLFAVRMGNRERARRELGEELNDRSRAMAKYRRQSLLLLVPLLPLLFALRDSFKSSGRT